MLPALPGARECLAEGYRSSLHPANAAALACIGQSVPREAVLDGLLVDPQTAGGLLAGVPEQRADACVAALRDAGYGAALVGRVVGNLPVGSVTLC